MTGELIDQRPKMLFTLPPGMEKNRLWQRRHRQGTMKKRLSIHSIAPRLLERRISEHPHFKHTIGFMAASIHTLLPARTLRCVFTPRPHLSSAFRRAVYRRQSNIGPELNRSFLELSCRSNLLRFHRRMSNRLRRSIVYGRCTPSLPRC